MVRESVPMVLHLRYPRRAEGFERQWEQLYRQLELVDRVGTITRLEMAVLPFEDENYAFHPELVPRVMIEGDPEPVREWLRERGFQNLYEEDTLLGIFTIGPQLEIGIDAWGPHVRVRSSEVMDLGVWRGLLVEMMELWGVSTAAIAPERTIWSQPSSHQLAGWITYTEKQWEWDPEVLTVSRYGAGWLLDPLPGCETQALAAVKHMLDVSVEPSQRSDAHLPAPSAEEVAYSQWITGVGPQPDGTVPKLVVDGVGFDGYVERAGKPIYLRALYRPKSFGWNGSISDSYRQHFLEKAYIDLAAVKKAGTGGIVEWHSNDPVEAYQLREVVARTGVQVFWSPVPKEWKPQS
ncbi:hypothetical protein HMPREF1531_00673 [Propionibacterium sp. oral taxon 192 str. F0372]|uniref:hypothetical protein n=1 Tax=Propionibacterium sp. oral taxon 192 TaxID=671222 RepID=UPI000353D938|nr:hypothetical protein [Propionibacterium sp. oral taxon 192]EPH06025.1 hypothetical protein HMPREF1531_00673 [Propionibacterium sp. oral taxon 192 str. F0372]